MNSSIRDSRIRRENLHGKAAKCSKRRTAEYVYAADVEKGEQEATKAQRASSTKVETNLLIGSSRCRVSNSKAASGGHWKWVYELRAGRLSFSLSPFPI